MKFIFTIILAYLMGSIPFGYIVTKYLMQVDIREYGSGNVGATNVARVSGLKAGIVVALFDILKGFLAVWISQLILFPDLSTLYLLPAALVVIIGHDYSVFLNFSGGKGVATTFGVILKLYPIACLVYALIWLLLVFKTRYVSLGSTVGALSLPIVTYFLPHNQYDLIFTSLLSIFILIAHRGNIHRLIKGEESRMNPKNMKRGGKNE